MAFSSSAVWEVQTGGSDTNNGGGFDAGVAGFPTDGAATLATSSAPVFTSASYTFVAGDVGAMLYIKSGTNWTVGWYPIASVSAGAATLNAAIGAASLGTAMNTVAGCATTASPTAATWGIDYSQSATSRLTFTDLVIGATTTQFTSAANPVGKNFVGNIISVTSGTGFTVQRVAVVSTSGTTATCDKTLGTAASTGGNGRLGGALASMGTASSVPAINNLVFVKSGTYSISSATTNVSGGASSPAVGITLVGYSTNRCYTNTDTQPLFNYNAASITGFNISGLVRNISADGNGQTSCKVTSTNTIFDLCLFKNFKVASSNCSWYNCTFTGWSASVGAQGSWFGCEAYANTVTPFSASTSTQSFFVNCIARGNTGASTDGFSLSRMNAAINCVSYGNGRDGFRLGDNAAAINCHAEANTGVGFNLTGSYSRVQSCSTYNNTGGSLTNVNNNVYVSPIAVTAGSVFVDPANSNFALNNTANQGALLRGTGYPSVYPAGLTSATPDIGVAQHADPAVISLSRMFAGF